ncbi:hypothetical protein HK097_007187 [Rhizophlyctis rosea]|uniref:Uncharacterized protein n=1 Tax=Rhizophlyctis rosea TaxID=64517 RepID=A0AAD5SE34_9FUNG|nr:hypothetical protein HK097_007187 [Rhizophlyctis rosea]
MSRLNLELTQLGNHSSVINNVPGTPSPEVSSRASFIESLLTIVEETDVIVDKLDEVVVWKTSMEALNLYSQYLSVFLEKKLVQVLKDKRAYDWTALAGLLDEEVADVAFNNGFSLEDVRKLVKGKDIILGKPWHKKLRAIYLQFAITDADWVLLRELKRERNNFGNPKVETAGASFQSDLKSVADRFVGDYVEFKEPVQKMLEALQGA